MEHFDFIKKSNYMEQLNKPANLTDVKAGRSMRMQAKVEERKSRRGDQFNKNRDFVVEKEANKQKNNLQVQQGPCGIDAKSQERLRQLQQWKAEKEKIKKAAAGGKLKPFIVSVVRPPLALFKSPTPVKKSATKSNGPPISDRITRSGRVDCRRPKIQTQPKQSTFAPPNAQFHPPQLKKIHNVVFGQKPVPKPNPVPTHSTTSKTRSKLDTAYAPLAPSIPSTSEPSTSRTTRSKSNASTSMAAKKEPKDQLTRATRNTKQKETIEKSVPKAKDNKKSKITNKNIKTRLQEQTQDEKESFMETQLIDGTNSSNHQQSSSPVNSLEISNGGSSTESMKTPPNQMTPEQLRNEISNMSPFVTLSRGKRNVRNEMLTKLKDGCLSDDSNDQKSAQHFRRQLDSEIIRLRQICAEWQSYNDENKSIIPENEQDLIFQAIGQTNLLISKKFEQFRGLVQRCEDHVVVEGEGLVTSTDLQGFWDMVFMQVENLDVRFKNLMELRQNGWVKEALEEVVPVKKAAPRAKRAAPATRKGNSKIREMIEAARKAAAAKFSKADPNVTSASLPAPTTLLEVLQPAEAPARTFDAGFFKVHSPMKERNTPSATPSRNASLLKGVLSSEARRMSSNKAISCSMAMMHASCMAKRMSNNVDLNTSFSPISSMAQVNLDATPARSILKTPLTNKKTKEGKKSIKVVLFTQEDEEDEIEQEPQPFEKLQFLEQTKNNMEITNSTDDIPHIIDKLDLFTIVTPVVGNVSGRASAGSTSSRRKLSRQRAIMPDDTENVPPMEEDLDIHTHHNQLTVQQPSMELKRITRSQRHALPDTLATSPPRLNVTTPKKTSRKTPRRTPNRRHTEVLPQPEISEDADFPLSPFTRKLSVLPSRSGEISGPHTKSDLITFDSPPLAPAPPAGNGGRQRRRSTRLASMAND